MTQPWQRILPTLQASCEGAGIVLYRDMMVRNGYNKSVTPITRILRIHADEF